MANTAPAKNEPQSASEVEPETLRSSRKECVKFILPYLVGIEAKCRAAGIQDMARPLGRALDIAETYLVE